MPTIIEKEIPSLGGWEKSKFETVSEFKSATEAEKFLLENGYTKACNKFDVFWYAPTEWPWDRYRIKTANALGQATGYASVD